MNSQHLPVGGEAVDLRNLLLHGAFPGGGLADALPDAAFAEERQDTPSPTLMLVGSNSGALTARGLAEVQADPSEQARLPQVGDLLDKYRIEQELGRGGFAVVYRATHTLMRTQVALKLLAPWVLERQPQLAEQLCEEARFTSLIDHPNVVRVYDVTSGPAWTYIVMELCDGPSLGRMLSEHGPLDAASAVQIARQVCAGLEAALGQGLIHRDIKPGNLLLTSGGQAKIVDFGLARSADAVPDAELGDEERGRISGTPAYIAPEQIRDPDAADHRADMYSLGATLFHALSGRPPFDGSDPLELIRRHLHELPPDLARLRPDLPAALCSLVLRLLAKDPADRPPTYRALEDALVTLQHGLSEHGSGNDHGSSRRFLRRITTMFRR